MSSLPERLADLRRDLLVSPPAIAALHDMPLAIFHYEPGEEQLCRRYLRLLINNLEQERKRVRVVSLARLFWEGLQRTEGVEKLGRQERQFGWGPIQRTLAALVSSPRYCPLVDQIVAQVGDLDPTDSIVFLVRAAALAPATYHMSKLLDELHGRIFVPTVLFYPGSREGQHGLTFMSMQDREASGNYRVKVY
jgi:hypothetical protein